MTVVKAALPLVGLLAVVALVVGGAVALTRGGESPSAPSGETATGETAGSIPAIDATAPAKVETATFALG